MNKSQLLNKLASPLLYYTGAYKRTWNKQARQQPYTIVLMYHRVVSDETFNTQHFGVERGTSAKVFEAQIRFMLKHFVPIQPSQSLDTSEHPLRFALTLDDGYEDNYSVAAPILQRLGVSAAFYVVSDFVGTDRLFWWEQLAHMIHKTQIPEIDIRFINPQDTTNTVLSLKTQTDREVSYEKISALLRAAPHANLSTLLLTLSDILAIPLRQEGREYGLMDWDQLKQLSAQGFEIGGHTATHCNLVDATADLLAEEVISSSAVIENQLSAPALTFAYPYGNYQKNNTELEQVLKNCGYKTAFTCEKGVVDKSSDALELSRAQLNRPYPFACGYNIQDTLKAVS